MKKLIYLSLAAAVLAVGCGSDKNMKAAGETAKKYAEHIKTRNYNTLVNEMDFGDNMTAADIRSQKEKYTWLLTDKIDPIVRNKGGVDRVEIVKTNVSNDGKTAKVDLKNVYGNGQTEDVTYDLVWVDNSWKIDMSGNRRVINTTTADGRDVSFTLKDYDDKEVIKQNVDGDRDFIKVKDEGDKQVVKVKEEGDREVTKVKEKEDEVVVKDKVNGEKDVTTIKK